MNGPGREFEDVAALASDSKDRGYVSEGCVSTRLVPPSSRLVARDAVVPGREVEHLPR